MDDRRTVWDAQGLGFGLAFAFLGVLFATGRDAGSLRSVHLLGVVVLAGGLGLLVPALQRALPEHAVHLPHLPHLPHRDTTSRDDEVVELP